MKKAAPLFIILLLVSMAFGAPVNQKQISDSANWVFHVDVQQFIDTDLGDLIIQEMKTEGVDEKLESLKELFGSNPLHDIHNITLYGPDNAEENAVAIISGNFAKEKLLSLVSLNETYAKAEYGKYTLHSWTEEKKDKPQVGVFASDTTIVISQSRAIVEKTLDVLDEKAKNITSTDKLLQLDSIPENTFIVAAAQGIGELAGDQPQADMLKHTTMLAFVAAERSGDLKVSLNLQAKTVETATQLYQVAQGMMALVSLQAQELEGVADLLKAVKITTEDKNVNFSFSYPSKQLFELIKKHSEKVEIEIDADSSLEEQKTE